MRRNEGVSEPRPRTRKLRILGKQPLEDGESFVKALRLSECGCAPQRGIFALRVCRQKTIIDRQRFVKTAKATQSIPARQLRIDR